MTVANAWHGAPPVITAECAHQIAGKPPKGCIWLYFLGILPSWFVIHVFFKGLCLAPDKRWLLTDELVCFVGAFLWPIILPMILFLLFMLWANNRPGL